MKKRGIAFLNRPERGQHASIGWGLEPRGEGGFICISDCLRKVSLDLDFSSKEDYRNSLFKVDTLINQLQDCREALVTAGRGKWSS